MLTGQRKGEDLNKSKGRGGMNNGQETNNFCFNYLSRNTASSATTMKKDISRTVSDFLYEWLISEDMGQLWYD